MQVRFVCENLYGFLLKCSENLSYLKENNVEYTLVMTHYYGSLSLFIKRLTFPSHVQMLPVI